MSAVNAFFYPRAANEREAVSCVQLRKCPCRCRGAEVSMPWQFCMYCQAGAHANNNHHINLLHWTQHVLKYRTERRAISVLIPDSEKLETGRREKLRLKEGKNIKIKSSRNSRYSRVPGSSSLWVWMGRIRLQRRAPPAGFLGSWGVSFCQNCVNNPSGWSSSTLSEPLAACPTTYTRI